jgi:hypothetical protein
MPLLFWVAKFKDGLIVKQSEGHFFVEDVLPNAEKLEVFWLTDEKESLRYGFAFTNGNIMLLKDGEGVSFKALGVELGVLPDLEYTFSELKEHPDFKLSNIRPIFFRRVTRVMDAADMTKVLSENFVYAIGFQGDIREPYLAQGAKEWSTRQRNVKRILYVREDGRVVLT